MSRTAWLILAFACRAAFGSELYIVPVYSDACCRGVVWQSNVTVTNPTRDAISVRVVDVIPYGSGAQCTQPYERRVLPHTSASFGGGCNGTELAAVVLESDAPVGITSDAVLFVNFVEAAREAVDPGRAWLAANVAYAIPQVRVTDRFPLSAPVPTSPSIRSNLFVVNPNTLPITVTFQRYSDWPMPVRTITVPARTATTMPLPFDDTTCAQGDVIGGECSTPLEIAADGSFYAGVSVINNRTQSATFRSPIAVPASAP